MTNSHVETISPDAAELPDTRDRDRKDIREHVMPPSGFRALVALVALDSPYLERDGKQFGSQPACSSRPKSISAVAR